MAALDLLLVPSRVRLIVPVTAGLSSLQAAVESKAAQMPGRSRARAPSAEEPVVEVQQGLPPVVGVPAVVLEDPPVVLEDPPVAVVAVADRTNAQERTTMPGDGYRSSRHGGIDDV
jgi:hypothetical protein